MRKILLTISLTLLHISAFSQSVNAFRAAEDGDVEAQMFLAQSYANGKNGLAKSPQKAYEWFLAAAKQGNALAQYEVGYRILAVGTGIPDDELQKESLDWMMKSARNGYAPAQVLIGDIYRQHGKYKEAFDLYKQAAGDPTFPGGMINLATSYYNGNGTVQSFDEALKYYTMAAEACEKLAAEEGMNRNQQKDLGNTYLGIAYCYINGKKNYKKAFEYYLKAIGEDIPQAYNDVAFLYAEGKGVEQSFQKAYEMVDLAISKDLNNPNFYDSKGEIYLMEGKTDKAREMWDKVLQLNPQAAEGNSKLALAMNNSVDSNIPVSTSNSDKTFAVICANEDYKRVASVPYAKNDGRTFAEYCKKTLGVPEKNVYLVEDATLGDMKYHINLLKKIAQAYNGEAKIIFYYAGHGIPDEGQKDGYLLPIDGYGNDATSGYSLKMLYEELASIPSKSVLVFMDACFSGAQRDGSMLEAARGVAIKPKTETPTGNLVIFSAASGDETAYPYNDKKHGLFTYFLLKKLQESKGDVTLDELGDYVVTNVKQESVTTNRKSQTPTVVPSASLGAAWKNIKLR